MEQQQLASSMGQWIAHSLADSDPATVNIIVIHNS